MRHIYSSLSDLLQTTESPDALHDSLSTIHCSWVDLRFGQGNCTLPPPPPPSPLSPLLLHDNMQYNTCTRKKVYVPVRGIYFLIPLPVVNNYKNNQNYLSFLPFCLSSLNQGCPLFLTGFTRIIMKNNDGVNGRTSLSISLSYINISSLISHYRVRTNSRTCQGLSSTTFLNFKDLI